VLVPKHKIQLILNGVDINKYSPPADIKAIRNSLSIPLEAFVVGFVGRLDPVKDISTLLKAFSTVEQLLTSPVCLLIVGGGNQLTDLKRAVEELGISKSVIFKGEMQNIPEIMQCMDLFALTSISEGMPMTLLEAMATGLPTVATRVGGVPDLIKDNENGYLADVKDSDAVAKIICSYAQNPEMRKIHGHNARMTAVSEYSISTMVSQYDIMYKSLISGGNQT
jgi:glycosyltransferase involved in cell wall biosynthesis